jgi:hypothetical protein
MEFLTANASQKNASDTHLGSLDGAAIIKGLRMGPAQFVSGSIRSFEGRNPLEKNGGGRAIRQAS